MVFITGSHQQFFKFSSNRLVAFFFLAVTFAVAVPFHHNRCVTFDSVSKTPHATSLTLAISKASEQRLQLRLLSSQVLVRIGSVFSCVVGHGRLADWCALVGWLVSYKHAGGNLKFIGTGACGRFRGMGRRKSAVERDQKKKAAPQWDQVRRSVLESNIVVISIVARVRGRVLHY